MASVNFSLDKVRREMSFFCGDQGEYYNKINMSADVLVDNRVVAVVKLYVKFYVYTLRSYDNNDYEKVYEFGTIEFHTPYYIPKMEPGWEGRASDFDRKPFHYRPFDVKDAIPLFSDKRDFTVTRDDDTFYKTYHLDVCGDVVHLSAFDGTKDVAKLLRAVLTGDGKALGSNCTDISSEISEGFSKFLVEVIGEGQDRNKDDVVAKEKEKPVPAKSDNIEASSGVTPTSDAWESEIIGSGFKGTGSRSSNAAGRVVVGGSPSKGVRVGGSGSLAQGTESVSPDGVVEGVVGRVREGTQKGKDGSLAQGTESVSPGGVVKNVVEEQGEGTAHTDENKHINPGVHVDPSNVAKRSSFSSRRKCGIAIGTGIGLLGVAISSIIGCALGLTSVSIGVASGIAAACALLSVVCAVVVGVAICSDKCASVSRDHVVGDFVSGSNSNSVHNSQMSSGEVNV